MGYIPNIKISRKAHAFLNMMGEITKLLCGITQYELTVILLEKIIEQEYPKYQAILKELHEKNVKEEEYPKYRAMLEELLEVKEVKEE